MIVTALSNYQYELLDFAGDRSIVFGRGTSYTVQSTDHGSPEETNADANVAVGDGIRFGRDFLNGRVITFELNLLTPSSAGAPEALSKLDALSSIWRNDWGRRKAGDLAVLRYRIGDRTRKVYGRPRKFAVTTGRAHQGWLPITMEFQCVDDKYYADVPEQHTVPMVAPASSGLVFPFDAPFVFNGNSVISLPSTFVVPGGEAAVPIFRINGPIIKPKIQQVGGWRIYFPDLTLTQSESVVIDPRSWIRTVLRNDGASMAGKMDAYSPSLSQMWLEPGEHELVLSGIDPTNTASLFTEVYSAYASY